MNKFVIGYEEEIIVITETRSDAEEFLLSILQEHAYENFIYEINYYNTDFNEYIESMKDGVRRNNIKTLYALALDDCSDGYWIEECVYLN